MRFGVALFVMTIVWLGCAPKQSSTVATNGRVSPTYQGPPEATFCSTPATYSDMVTVSGTATYNRREPWGSYLLGGLGSAKTSGVTHPATNHPIRQAEVRVLDPSGAVVQCGSTSDTGTFSVSIPRGNTKYTVQVNSRAFNDLMKVSVLTAPEKNTFYSLSTTVSATGNSSVGTLTATADGDLLGGAFNIMDQIYEANLFLQSKVATCSTRFAGCQDIDSTTSTTKKLKKVVAYWSKGFNPNNYFGYSSGLSFYLPGYSRLFILGGNNGVVDTVDTDHFDNSVIIHEYGHFLEDTVGKSDSPGGSHNGDDVIDPRLAWSEGWGNFFQAAVRNDPHYIDTIGNDDGGTTDMAFYTDLETASNGNDQPQFDGEGNYREFSITRLLWDVVDPLRAPGPQETLHGGTDNVVDGFIEIWASFSSTVRGFKYGGYAFRNIGLLHLIQESLASQMVNPAQDWTGLRKIEWQEGDEARYGQNLVVTAGTACSGVTLLQPTGDTTHVYTYQTIDPSIGFTSDGGQLSGSNQFQNNLFFHFKAPASGTNTIKLRYQDADGTPQEADLDLYIYKDGYEFANPNDMVGYSRKDATGVVNAPEADETASVAFVKDAHYLINVNAYAGGNLGSQAYFNLYYGSSLLCPANIVP